MNNLLLSTLDESGKYTSKELQLLQHELIHVELKKGETILPKDVVCSEVHFINKGSAYQYEIDDNLDQNIIDLFTEKDWCFNVKSFSSRRPSENYITAFEDTFTSKLTIESIHKLIAIAPSFLQMGEILNTANNRVHFFDKNYTPNQKYAHLLKEKSDLILKFPQKIIASYLKITPETLSRVRNRIHTS